MSKSKSNFKNRLLAAALAMTMVFGMIPLSGVSVFAATDAHPDYVTITVVDENGDAVEGATVDYEISSVTYGTSQEQEISDVNGTVEIWPSASFADDIYVAATISKTGYKTDSTTVSSANVVSADQDFRVTLISTTITDVSISGRSLTYNGEDQLAVSVNEKPGDTVSYEIDGIPVAEPKVKDHRTYEIKVTVERDGFDTLVKTVTVTVEKADIEGIDIAGKTLKYNETEQELITLTGTPEEGDIVTYEVNGVEGAPKATNIGDYIVKITIDRGNNYNIFTKTVNSEIILGEIDLGDLRIKGLEGVYTGAPQEAIIKTGDGNYVLEYKLDNGSWQTDIPDVTDAGSYTVQVKATKTDYEDKDVPVEAAESAVYPFNVYIAKAEQDLSFNNSNYTNGAEGTTTFDKTDASNNVYDFSATAEDVVDAEVNSNEIVYSIVNASDDGLNIDDIATINASTGEVTVKAAGCVTITAERLGNDNYNDISVSYTLIIAMPAGDLVSFDQPSKEYIIGQNNGTVSDMTAAKANPDDNGTLTYSINRTDIGLSVNSSTGAITVSNYLTLSDVMLHNNGSVSVLVTVSKTAGTKGVGSRKREVYAADSASYTVNISFFETPSNPYIIEGTIGENDWYKSAIEVTATNDITYTIAKNCNPTEFGASVTFNDQGTDNRYVFLRDVATGGITSRILLGGVKIDTVKPDVLKMKIEYEELNLIQKIGSALGFYNPSITITFTAEDVTSGIDHIDWVYTKEGGVSNSNHPETQNGELAVSISGNTATATLTLTASDAEQYRGNLSFTATDKAGNESDSVTDNGYTFVVDTISPTQSVRHELETPGEIIPVELNGQYYYSGDVKFTFTIQEANFYRDDVIVSVSKDGAAAIAVAPTWVDNSVDEHVGAYTLTGDGDYIVYMTYTDKSGNVMTAYESETITIDASKPILDFSFNQAEQKTVFTVTEHNFRPEDIEVETVAKDINGNVISANDLTQMLHNATWTQSGDTYTFETDDYVDGIYDLVIKYKDISGNAADDCEPDIFIIDHTKPAGVMIEYSQSIMDTVLGAITLGFYNPDVTVTFTAYDVTSGVKDFTWDYTRQTEASEINLDADGGTIVAVQDSSDKSKFTATVTLPREAAQQLRGSLAVVATDEYENKSDKITDSGNVIVVDTIAPEMTVEYSEESRQVGSKYYYNGDITATFTVTEANFFKEDVSVKVSKDGGTPYAVTPTWTDKSVDEHIGVYTITGDGHYVISVEYIDRAENTMTPYTSDERTIDTIKPEIGVVYANKNTLNKLNDSDNNMREYYDAVQTATVTITEHNFNADEVEFDIIGKDVTGATLNIDSLISKSAWSSNGDVHTLTITYSGDANYTFDIAYTDLATNEAADYTPDYFTVDQTAPTNLTVSYSTSLFETVLESITFGYYNAKMTVTITADDATAGIHWFKYSYLNATGVSGGNAELLDQAIENANNNIRYSEDGKTATASFEIPKMVLKNDNQFNGTVEFTAHDRSENSTDKADAYRVVVDNIAPTATISYNDPVQSANGISYYAGDINATINITEANFFSQDVLVTVTRGGTAIPVTVNWAENSVDSHTGTFTLSGDGDYIVRVTYKDRSENVMANYESNQLTIDTTKPSIKIDGMANESANNQETIKFTITADDTNFDISKFNPELTVVTLNGSKTIPNGKLEPITVGKTYYYEFDKLEEDGIYTLECTVTDMSGNSTSDIVVTDSDNASMQTVIFSVNRNGSTFMLDDNTTKLVETYYVQNVLNNVVVIETNADPLQSYKVTLNGRELTEGSEYNVAKDEADGSWKKYTYSVEKSLFEAEGEYKVVVSSKDKAENDAYSDIKSAEVTYVVDRTAPVLTISGLQDGGRYQVETQTVTVIPKDDGGKLDSIKIVGNDGAALLDLTGEELFNALDENNGQLTFDIPSGYNQSIQVLCNDCAQDENGKTNLYDNTFSNVTVSTNLFVIFFANKPLFFGSIAGVVLLAGGLWFFLIFKRRKKKEEAK